MRGIACARVWVVFVCDVGGVAVVNVLFPVVVVATVCVCLSVVVLECVMCVMSNRVLGVICSVCVWCNVFVVCVMFCCVCGCCVMGLLVCESCGCVCCELLR